MKSTWNHSLEKRKGWGERMKIIYIEFNKKSGKHSIHEKGSLQK